MRREPMNELKSGPSEFDIGERIAIGIAAASGLITAACISGLPSTSCTALVQTYTFSVVCFGSTALGALLSLLYIYICRPRISFVKNNSKKIMGAQLLIKCYRGALYCSVAITSYLFAASSFVSTQNLKDATSQCFDGSDVELAQRVHQKIKLESPFEWRPWPVDK
jgi:hypothetical protein